MVPTEAAAYALLEDLRWHGQPVCPHCGSAAEHRYIEPRNGVSRKTRTGSMSERRVWRCAERECRKQFSVLTGTVMHGTKISVRTWVLVFFEFVSSKNSISAWAVSRKYEITNESAWHMLHRLREAAKENPLTGVLSGAVQADETWIGGKPSNRHRTAPSEPRRGPAHTDKQPVFSLVHYETRAVRSHVVADVTGVSLLPAMREVTDLPNVWLQSDGGPAYKSIAPHVRDHQWVDHNSGQYVGPGGVGTNLVENFFSQLKRSIDGTHHHVSREHLARYLAQFDFMFTHCRRTDSERMRLRLANVGGRRLTYKPLQAR